LGQGVVGKQKRRENNAAMPQEMQRARSKYHFFATTNKKVGAILIAMVIDVIATDLISTSKIQYWHTKLVF
jgi:hypothetical protein